MAAYCFEVRHPQDNELHVRTNLQVFITSLIFGAKFILFLQSGVIWAGKKGCYVLYYDGPEQQQVIIVEQIAKHLSNFADLHLEINQKKCRAMIQYIIDRVLT